MTIFAMDGQANGVKVSFELTIMTCELYYELLNYYNETFFVVTIHRVIAKLSIVIN